MTPRTVSVVIPTFNKARSLQRTLRSIVAQTPPWPTEIIVVDDGSSDETRSVCHAFGVQYHYLPRPAPSNPGPARNVGIRAAAGDVVILQSDEVEHRTPNLMAHLVARLTPTTATFATVYNVAEDGTALNAICSSRIPRPYGFLGAIWTADLYAIGGNDEEFLYREGGEDRWMGRCLEKLPRRCLYCDDLIGWHYDHPHNGWSAEHAQRAKRLYYAKRRLADQGLHPWTARSGAWA